MAEDELEAKPKKTTRREFMKGAGIGAAGLVVGGALGHEALPPRQVPAPQAAPAGEEVPDAKAFLVVDSKKCGGCASCMLACSLVHEGKSNLSLARIQILNDPFGAYPTDVTMALCRQCSDPLCYDACPLKDEAFVIDKETGVRRIVEDKCVGCRKCVDACYYAPSRVIWDPEREIALKCDMCQNTPYWDGQGKQACVEVCPMKAIQVTTKKPRSTKNFEVNMRGPGWAKLDLPRD